MMGSRDNLHKCLVDLAKRSIDEPCSKTQGGIKKFLESPLPNREDWKYTKLKWESNSIALPSLTEQDLNTSNIKEFSKWAPEQIFKNRIVIYNGQVLFPLSSFSSDIKLITLDNLDAEYVNMYLDKAICPENYFTKLNTALANGFLLEVKQNTKIVSPLEIIYAYDSDQPALCQTKSIVVIHENSSLTLLTRTCFKNNNVNLCNNVFEAFVKKEAELVKYHIDSDEYTHPNNQNISSFFINQDHQSKSRLYDFSFSEQLVRNNVNIFLKSEFAKSQLYSMSLLNNDAHVDNTINVTHNAPNCSSEQVYKGVYDGFSTGVFNGGVHVCKVAQKTDAIQQNNSILLSDSATIHAKPQLEIFADDVTCAHGCTIGQIDEKSLFYIRSRGISEKSANIMLLVAFFNDVISRIGNVKIKEEVMLSLTKLLKK
jgi:Fe-S cluster assembly protein SufD